MSKVKATRLEMKWRTIYNGVDCGIFVMRHMETYMGQRCNKWDCGLDDESDTQTDQLNALRVKYLTKILLSKINILRDKVITEADIIAKKRRSEEVDII